MTATKQPGVVDFARSLYTRHPELERPVRWQHFLRMAQRSRISIRIVPLSRPARLIRYGQSLCIRINQTLTHHERTLYGMHELCHVWRDEVGQACVYADQDTVAKDPAEDFADLFAWYVTSEARDYQIPVAMRRPRPRPWATKISQLELAGISLGAIATLTSQPEERVLNWRRGTVNPDPATARILERIISAMPRRVIPR